MDEKQDCGLESSRSANTIVLIVCIIAIVFIEVVALMKGIDGKLLAVAIGAIAGLGGYTLPKLLSFRIK